MTLAEALLAIRNGTISTVDLTAASIDSAGAIALAEALQVNKSVISISLDRNKIGPAGVVALAQMLKVNKTVIFIDLSNCVLEVKGASVVGGLGNNVIGYDGLMALTEALKVNNTLIGIVLDGLSLGAFGVNAFAEALKVNKTIKMISLANNHIGPGFGSDGAIALAKALEANSSVTQIVLRNNQISVAGATALAGALQHNNTVTLLELGGNPHIDQEGVTAIRDALAVNKTITELHLDTECFGEFEEDEGYVDSFSDELSDDIEYYLDLNKVSQGLKMLPSHLAFSVMFQSGSFDMERPEIGGFGSGWSDHFDIPFIHYTLTHTNRMIQRCQEALENRTAKRNAAQDGWGWRASWPARTGENELNVRNEWLRHVVSFHLRCIDLETDDSPSNDLHPFVLAAIDTLSQMTNDDIHYTNACQELGKYFYHRTTNLPHGAQRNEFQQFALHFLSKAGDESQRMAAQLSWALIHHSSTAVSSTSQLPENLTHAETVTLIEKGCTLISKDVINTSTKKDFDETNVLAAIDSTRDQALPTSQKYQLIAVLDQLGSQEKLKENSGATNSTLFAPAVRGTPESLKEAAAALKKFIGEEFAQEPTKEQIAVLNEQDVIKEFFKAGRANLVAEKEVQTVAKFVEVLVEKANAERAVEQPEVAVCQ